MSIIDETLEANRKYRKNYDPTLGKRVAPKISVVACMDPRLSDLPGILGLPQADIDVIRTGGPAVTEDVLGTTEILLLNHTGRGFTTFTDEQMNAKLSASTGDASPAPVRFFSYKDPEENTREQIKKVRSHPWIAKDIPVRGFIFDVDTGRLREVKVLEGERAADSRSLFVVHRPHNSCFRPGGAGADSNGHERTTNPGSRSNECLGNDHRKPPVLNLFRARADTALPQQPNI